jgi:hypothetical protein
MLFPTSNIDGYHCSIFTHSPLFNVKKKLRDYTKAAWEKFLSLDDPKMQVKPIGNVKSLQGSRRQIQTPLPWQRCGEDERELAPAFRTHRDARSAQRVRWHTPRRSRGA